jgi:hypothetical protein
MSTPISEFQHQQLRELRRRLLRLHKILLDIERAAYEKARGRVSSGELLQLVINHEQFAWLHSISELIVRIDEALDAKEPMTSSDARALLDSAKGLLKPSVTGTPFERRYFQVLQDKVEAVILHREALEVCDRQE